MGSGDVSYGKKTRECAKRKSNLTYGIIDSKSVKTTYACEDKGIDGDKKIKWRKRHIVVDAMGDLLAINVRAANVHDTKSEINPTKSAFDKYPTIQKFCGDAGYRKSFKEAVSEQLDLEVDISQRIKQEFEILPKRWGVERTFAWSDNSRRLSKDFEIKTIYTENMFIISHLHTLLRRY
jgi:putative transposase